MKAASIRKAVFFFHNCSAFITLLFKVATTGASGPFLTVLRWEVFAYIANGKCVIRNLFTYVPSVKIMCSNICLLNHCCSSQLRKKIVYLHNKTGESLQIDYLPAFNIIIV